jgi:hypothetical protein
MVFGIFGNDTYTLTHVGFPFDHLSPSHVVGAVSLA